MAKVLSNNKIAMRQLCHSILSELGSKGFSRSHEKVGRAIKFFQTTSCNNEDVNIVKSSVRNITFPATPIVDFIWDKSVAQHANKPALVSMQIITHNKTIYIYIYNTPTIPNKLQFHS